MALYEVKIEGRLIGMRADEIARKAFPELPAHVVRRSFEKRDVKLDAVRVKPDARAEEGQTLRLYCMEQNSAETLDVVYEDADVLLVNKRAGMMVEGEDGSTTLAQLCLKHVRADAPEAYAPVPCHRLDAQTCGLVVFAKNPRAEAILLECFEKRTLDKRYECLVRGIPKPPKATCRAFLRKDAEAGRVTILDHEARGARTIITEYETLETGPISRLQVHLVTGRTHQIRAHMAAMGHPLLGDDLYGDRALNRRMKARALMLCARTLRLETGGKLKQLDGRTFEVKCPF